MSEMEDFQESSQAPYPDSMPTEQHGHTDEEFDLAIRILKQFKPKDQNQLFEITSQYGKGGGMALTATIVFWWLLIYRWDEDMSVGTSLFFGLNFAQVAIAVVVLCMSSTISSDASRVRGTFMLSPFSGGMLILSALYIAEPLIASLVFGQYDASLGLWRSMRLGILWAGAWISASMLTLSLKLAWVKKFCENWGYEMNSLAAVDAPAESKE
jgi:hypothetical protein